MICALTAGERALHPAGAAVRPRPHGRAAAVHQPQRRLHHLPAAQAGRRHRQRRAAGTPPGTLFFLTFSFFLPLRYPVSIDFRGSGGRGKLSGALGTSGCPAYQFVLTIYLNTYLYRSFINLSRRVWIMSHKEKNAEIFFFER